MHKSLSSHTQLLLNRPACDDLCALIHNLYIAEICRDDGAIFSLLQYESVLSLNSRLWKMQQSENSELKDR